MIAKSIFLKDIKGMKYSTKYSDAIHILAYIEMLKGTDLSSDRIAQSVETNPAYVRRIMSDLRTAGLIESQREKLNLNY